MCTWCMDAGRWYAISQAPHHLPKLDAIAEYRTSPLFSAEERAALDFATELTERKAVSPGSVAALRQHCSGARDLRDSLRGLEQPGIRSDGLCELAAAGNQLAGRTPLHAAAATLNAIAAHPDPVPALMAEGGVGWAADAPASAARGLATGGIARVGQLNLLQPLLAITWSAVILREHIPAVVPLTAIAVRAAMTLCVNSRG